MKTLFKSKIALLAIAAAMAISCKKAANAGQGGTSGTVADSTNVNGNNGSGTNGTGTNGSGTNGTGRP